MSTVTNFRIKRLSLHKLALALAVAASTSACVTSGKYFGSDTNWIKSNKTSQDDVRGLLGSPFMVGNSGGSPTWTYGYYRYKLLGESFTKELKFYWNQDRTVQSYSFNSSFPEDTGTVKPAKAQPAVAQPPQVKYP